MVSQKTNHFWTLYKFVMMVTGLCVAGESIAKDKTAACELLRVFRSVNLSKAERLLKAGRNPFDVCAIAGKQISPAHFVIGQSPSPEMIKLVISYYLNNKSVNANALGDFNALWVGGAYEMLEKTSLLHLAAMTANADAILELGKKVGIEPNLVAKMEIPTGSFAQTPRALFFWQKSLQKISPKQADLAEAALDKIGANLSNCDVLLELADPDVSGSNLRSGPGSEFSVVERIISHGANPALMYATAWQGGWYKISTFYPEGAASLEGLRCASKRDLSPTSAWISAKLIRAPHFFEKHKDKPNGPIAASYCFAQTLVVKSKDKKEFGYTTDDLLNSMSLNCPAAE